MWIHIGFKSSMNMMHIILNHHNLKAYT